MIPLQGVRVLDLSRLLPGPYATLVLADLGAEVVKLEDPRGGDPLRGVPPMVGRASGAFHALNRNKRSVAVDLRAEGGAEVLLRLASAFDVLVESFRPGVLERLGASPEALRARSPRLIVCSITAYGQTGPMRGLAGHDLNACALSGALALNGPPEEPLPFGVQPADLSAAWIAVAGILAALHRRGVTGEGGMVDVSMAEGALGMLGMALGMAAAREAPLRREELLSGGAACYRAYRTRDGRFVALGALEPVFFERFCAAAGRPELAAHQFDDGGRGPVEELAALFAARTRDAWAELGRREDVCLTPVLEGDEPLQQAQFLERGVFGTVATPWEGAELPALRTPVRLDGESMPLAPAPPLGEGTDEMLASAGFTAGETAALRARGVVGARE